MSSSHNKGLIGKISFKNLVFISRKKVIRSNKKMIKNFYIIFWLFGLINNVLYVVILSAAVDLIGPSFPKSIILLMDILPSLLIKLLCPFFIHKIKYNKRIISLIILSLSGMLLISLNNNANFGFTLFGIFLASISSGFGEVTFLQLTNVYENNALNGWSSGTGGAGIIGSGVYLLLTTTLNIPIKISLFLFALLPLGFLLYWQLDLIALEENQTLFLKKDVNIKQTLNDIKELIVPYMLPLTTVYFFEYLINQSVAPTLLFPIDAENATFFKKYRDIYVTYGTLYQFGVFISRTSGKFIRLKNLHILSLLQGINFILTVCQSWFYITESPKWMMILIFYEGLLGGASYVNTFLNILEFVDPSLKEFALGSVSIADSLGVFLASLFGLGLEPALCKHQLSHNKPWCRME